MDRMPRALQPALNGWEDTMAKAMFGAGCFWGVEDAFRAVEGVSDVAVGYSGGAIDDPSYEMVCGGNTGHAEVVEVTFEPDAVSYAELLEVLWSIHDATTLNRQGPDMGTQYRSAIYYYDDAQKAEAEASKAAQEAAGRYPGPIVTEISAASPFYRGEEYHQQYFAKRGMANCHVARY